MTAWVERDEKGALRRITWLDLAPYRARLGLFRAPSQRHYLVMLGGDQHAEILNRLGFARQKAGYWLTRLRSMDEQLSAIQRAFPKAQKRQVDLKDPRQTAWLFMRDGKKRKPDPARPASEYVRMMQKTLLGVNHFGQDVYEGVDGRFVHDRAGNRIVREADLSVPQPAVFLRATNAEELQLCADGFVQLLMSGADGLDIRHFTRVVFDRPDAQITDEDVTTVARTIAMAMERRVMRMERGSLRDAFNAAVRLYEACPDRALLPAPPLPFDIVTQRLIGSGDEVAQHTVAVFEAASPGVVAALPTAGHASIHARDERIAGEIRQLLQYHAAPQKEVVTDEPADFAAHFQIADLNDDLDDVPPYILGDREIGRPDLAYMLRMLDDREAAGRSVVVLRDPLDDDVTYVFQAIAHTYHIEGITRVNGALRSGRMEGDGTIVAVVGHRRPEPDPNAATPPIRNVFSFQELWQWSSGVLAERSRLEQARHLEEEAGEADEELNNYQAPYTPASRIAPPVSRVPRHLDGATREALANLIRRRGSIDAFVCERLDWTPEELRERLTAEQVDAVGMAIDAIEEGRPFICGDQMGLGKGRFCAALARYGYLRNKKVVFFTEKSSLFSDFWRDMRAIGSEDLFLDERRGVRPFILNSDRNADITDKFTGELILPAGRPSEKKRVIDSGQWPENVPLVLATYSQFNKKESVKATWLHGIVDEDVLVIEDESQNQTGDSRTANNLQGLFGKAWATIRSSGTMAHNVKTLTSYDGILPPGMTKNAYAEILQKGGEIVQEIAAADLVRRGFMLRRELPAPESGMELFVDNERLDRNRSYIDHLAPVFSAMAYLSGDVDKIVSRLNEARARAAEQHAIQQAMRRGQALTDEARRKVRKKAMNIAGTAFGSPLHKLGRLALLGLKTEFAVERALAALENGEKPVILIQSTGETLLKEILRDQEEAIEAGELRIDMPDYKALLRRTLDTITTVTRREGGARQVIDLAEREPDVAAARDEILGMIEELPDLPVSPIDIIRQRIAAAGYTCEELTGRKLRWLDGAIVPRDDGNDTEIQARFNSGETDALIITKTTGYSIHASSAFADQRPRVMIELESHEDPRQLLQALKRIDRLDQIQRPRYEVLSTGLPVDYRLSAHRNKKVSRVSAITAADTDHPALVSGVIDMFNAVGDVVVKRYLETRPELARRLGLPEIQVDEESVGRFSPVESVDRTWANQLSARYWLLPWQEQERIYNEIMAEYEATIAELDALGLNPLRTKEMKGGWRVIRREIFETGGAGFDEPVWLTTIEGEEEIHPFRSQDLLEQIESGRRMMGLATGQEAAARLRAQRETLLNEALAKTRGAYQSVEDALRAPIQNPVRQTREKIDTLIRHYERLMPGAEIRFGTSFGLQHGIVTYVKIPPEGFEMMASSCRIKYVCAGRDKIESSSLAGLMRSADFSIGQGINGAFRDEILGRYDQAPAGVFPIRHRIMEGNLFRALQLQIDHKLGEMVLWRDDRGVAHRGVKLSQAALGLAGLPVRMAEPEQVLAYLRSGQHQLCCTTTMTFKETSLRSLEDGRVVLSLPTRTGKFGWLYERDPDLLDFARNMTVKDGPCIDRIGDPDLQRLARQELVKVRVSRGRPILHLTGEAQEFFIRRLMAQDIHFYAGPSAREWANQWIEETREQRQAQEQEVELHPHIAREVQDYLERSEADANNALAALCA